jgi:hypothetical protein
MPTVYQPKQRRKSTSTRPTGGSPLSLSAQRQQLTKNGQHLSLSRQHGEGTADYTQTINPPLKRTLNASGNDPQLLAEIFKPTVEAMQALNMLTLSHTPAGKFFILLPTNIFNDDLTLKTANTVGK